MGKKPNKESKKSAKAGLVEKNGELCPKFKVVLREVFQRFDVDRDEALSLKELEAFAAVTSSGDINRDELRQLGNYFDVNAKGDLTLKGFEQMYLMQTNHQPADTWRDLKLLGYPESLEPFNVGAGNPELGDGHCSKDVNAPSTPSKVDAEAMNELRAALVELKENADSAAAHRRVGLALKGVGRDAAAEKSLQKARELDKAAGVDDANAASTVQQLD
jgi:hypothetical protein